MIIGGMVTVLVVGMWGFRMWIIIDGDEGVRDVCLV